MFSQKPPLATYLDPDSKAIDLANFCRRLLAEWQYAEDSKPRGNLVKIKTAQSALASPAAFEAITAWFRETGVPVPPDMLQFLRQVPITEYSIIDQPPGPLPWITAKDFTRNAESLNLKPEKLIEIYWKTKLITRDASIPCAVGQLVENFKRVGYEGFLLPNGKVVPFDSMHMVDLCFFPKDLGVVSYLPPEEFQGIYDPCNLMEPFHRHHCEHRNIFHAQHLVIVFNLPEIDSQGNLGKVMVLDPTCARYGMKGQNGQLLYWGDYFEDYINIFPAGTVIEFEGKEFHKYNYLEPQLSEYFHDCGDPLMKGVMDNLTLDCCGYCGEVERKENPKIKLSKCSRCMKAYYCDTICQKLAWKAHKLECKSK